MDAPEVRRLQPGEEREFVKSLRVPFLDPLTPDDEDGGRPLRGVRSTEVDRSWVATDEGRFVANCAIHTLDVTVPAAPGRPCPVLPMAGVTRVGVHPTHRRRGLLTRMMGVMADDARARGEPLAGLLASEAVIYARFGYGLASEQAEYEIDTREAALLSRPAPVALRLVERDEAAKLLPDLFDGLRRSRAGEPSRRTTAWEEYIEDAPGRRHGGNPAFVAACSDGYVVYRSVEAPGNWRRDRILVEELRGATPEVEAALWEFIFSIDLTDEVKVLRGALDEPLRWRLADPRQLRLTATEDRLHLRVLDVAAAFEGRGYRSEGRLVLEVVDPPVAPGPDPVPGTWVLEAGPDGATCRRAPSGAAADLRLDVTALGALYMGGYPASLLGAAGRVEEMRPGGLARADRVLSTWPAPRTGTGF